MANTFSQICIQVVFAVKYRECLIAASWREELQKYIAGIIRNRGQKTLAIFCMPDHTHILIGMNPSISISDLVRDIKSVSSKFINEKRFLRGRFSWQEGFGVFSYSKDAIPTVADYIQKQEIHHAKKSFKDEFIEILKSQGVEFDEKYLFEWFD